MITQNAWQLNRLKCKLCYACTATIHFYTFNPLTSWASRPYERHISQYYLCYLTFNLSFIPLEVNTGPFVDDNVWSCLMNCVPLLSVSGQSYSIRLSTSRLSEIGNTRQSQKFCWQQYLLQSCHFSSFEMIHFFLFHFYTISLFPLRASEGRLGMSDISPLSGISGLSFDST